MAQAFITRRKGGGGVNKDLPAQVTAFTATADSTPSITLSWQNPSEYWAGTLIVKKAGSAPKGVNDGEKVYKGEGTSYTDFDVQFDTEYFYRAFPFNEKKQYQTAVNVASAKPLSGIALSELAEGTLININEGGTAVPFYLAKHDYESGLNGAGRQLFVRKDCYDKRRWHNSNVNAYATSSIDSWQNSTYKAKLSAAVQEMMGTTKFYYRLGSGSTTVTTLIRAIFLLSLDELKGESSGWGKMGGSILPIASALQSAYLNGSLVDQWTRSVISDSAVDLAPTGSSYVPYGVDCTETCGSRPCFTLPATAMVYPEPNADGSYSLIE